MSDDRTGPDEAREAPSGVDERGAVERERERRRAAEERARALERDLLAAERRARTAERRLGRVLAAPPIRAAISARGALLGARDRLLVGLARAARGPGALRYRLAGWRHARAIRASPAAEAAFIERVRAESPAAARADGPMVSIVTLNRDGEPLLRRLLPALEQTAYRPIELVVVDNGSSDGSVAFLEGTSFRFPVRIVRNTANRSFAEANEQGVAASSGELLLFLNNDVEPIHPGWLGHLVATVVDHGATASGARLVYPLHRGGRRAGGQHPDLSLQHRGVEFAIDEGLAVPRVLGAGEDPFGPDATAVAEVPALTAACFLLRRETYQALGGFGPGYDYGWEDMDLCLRLRAGGARLVYDGRAVLFHHESTTRARDTAAAVRARREANRDRFVGAWAPRLYREVLSDALDGAGRWSRSPLRVIVAASPMQEPMLAKALEEGLAGLGWSVLPRDGPHASKPSGRRGSGTRAQHPDVVVNLDPRLDLRALPGDPVTIAWIAATPDDWIGTPWFDRHDVVIVGGEAARSVVEAGGAKVASLAPTDGGDPESLAQAVRNAMRGWAGSRRVAIRTGPPSHEAAPRWGDTWFGGVLQRELERAGHPTVVGILPEWTGAADARADITLHLFGKSDAPIRPGQLNLLWQISHPDLASPELYSRYDLAFVASDAFAERMRSLVATPVMPLHQATDPTRFHPAEGGPVHSLLFVGNSRNVRRRILDDLLPTTHDLAVYGAGWTPDLLDPRYVAGTSIPNEELHRFYAAAAIVLCDHWSDMRDEGFIANRLYDVLASGGFVISDDVDGIEAEFDGAVVTYRAPAELRALVDRWLADPEGRRDRAERGRRVVLDRHTFRNRVTAMLDATRPMLEARPARLTPD